MQALFSQKGLPSTIWLNRVQKPLLSGFWLNRVCMLTLYVLLYSLVGQRAKQMGNWLKEEADEGRYAWSSNGLKTVEYEARIEKLTTKSLAKLEKSFTIHLSAFKVAVRMTVENMVYAGEALEAIKRISPHGTFERTLDRLGVSITDAKRFRLVARGFGQGRFELTEVFGWGLQRLCSEIRKAEKAESKVFTEKPKVDRIPSEIKAQKKIFKEAIEAAHFVGEATNSEEGRKALLALRESIDEVLDDMDRRKRQSPRG